MVDAEDIPPSKPKRIYRKPELKRLGPQAAVKLLKPRAVAGDKAAQRLIEAIVDKHGSRN
jgi:hypothetical protein